MENTILIQKIREFLQEHNNPVLVEKYARYFKNNYDAYGCSSEQLKEITNTISDDNSFTYQTVCEISYELFKSTKYEETSIACILLLKFKKNFSIDTFNLLGELFDIGVRNWAHCDYICSEVISVFFKKGIINYSNFDKWRFAANSYKRRAVPVALIKTLKTFDNYQTYFDYLEPIMMCEEREVRQGIGWFLKESWKIKPDVTESFLLKWKDHAPRLIIQYATEKMLPEQKLRFRKEKNTGLV